MSRLSRWRKRCVDMGIEEATEEPEVNSLGIDRSLVNVDIDLETNVEPPEDNWVDIDIPGRTSISNQTIINNETISSTERSIIQSAQLGSGLTSYMETHQQQRIAAMRAQQQAYNTTVGYTSTRPENAEIYINDDLSSYSFGTADFGIKIKECQEATGVSVVDLDPQFSEIVDNNFWELMDKDKKVIYVTPYIYEVTLDHQIAERDENGAYVYKYKGERRTADSNILRFEFDSKLIKEEVENLFTGTSHIISITGDFRTTTVNENGE